jgi:uncharacterized surface protein with fasciclin (FAS1) repeats
MGNTNSGSQPEDQGSSTPMSGNQQTQSNQIAENSNSSDKTMEQSNMAKEAQNIVAVASGSKDHTTLVAAVKAAGLVETLQGEGPFTVFAPVNPAFDALPAGTLDSLLMPENKDQLVGILTYHVVPTKAMSADVVKMITDGGGSATVNTVAGGTLTLKTSGGKVTVTDESGNVATVTAADLEASNGVIHVIDKVLLPHS